ncbi:MAG: hypothetical protein RLZZ210_1383 [Pseudomonadota bacterium]|jgi:O-6-methylguanine DNA methyltransferase
MLAYTHKNSSYYFTLTNLAKLSNTIDLSKLEYLEYENKNPDLLLHLCFYADYLVGVKFVRFNNQKVIPTHILKDTAIWDNLNNENYAIRFIQKNDKKLSSIYKNWFNFLDEYFNKKLNINKISTINTNIVELKLACRKATEFQFSVWLELLKVKQLSTYSNLAENIAREKAVRAVGTSVSQNPIGIFIPCHRILPKDIFAKSVQANKPFSDVGQYMNGADIKRFLLNLEHDFD